MITIYIPGFPQVTWERRYGDAQILHDEAGNAIVIDGGEAMLYNKLIAYCRNKGITHITYILTHWHIDHDSGMKAFLDVSGICVDKIYCPPPGELQGLQESGVGDDYRRALRRINQAKGLGKSIVYPPAGSFTDITVGEIRCRIWRRSARKSDQNDREVNNTSMQTYFPDLWYLSGGDMIDKQDFLRTKPGPVVVMKGYHHGNGDGKEDLQTLKTWGVQLYWYNDVEPKGKGIGSTSFSQWGAGKAKGLITTVLRTDSDIVMTAANGKLKVQKGSSTWSFDVPYHGKGFEGWYKVGDKWCYQYADGSYAVGWAKLGWSKGTDWFYFNPANGVMLTGWVYTGGFWYWLDPATGAMQVGWLGYKGKWCYLEPEAGKNQGHAYCNQTAVIDGKMYRFDKNCYATEVKAGYPRADIVSLAQSLVGTREGGTIHHRIIDQYNARKPLPRGYAVKYTDAWCATFCSYLAIACGYTAIIPVECGCPQWITLAKGMGCWTESDTYTPRPGDFILYDWQDGGSGDNTGTPDHIGIIEKVEGSAITVIEGNYNDSVKRRQITIGGRYIRGYVTPKYSD